MPVSLESTAPAAQLEKLADFSLLLAGDGEILRVEVSADELGDSLPDDWVGQNWVDTVTAESRERLAAMLAEAGSDSDQVPRQDLVQVLEDGSELPVEYRLLSLQGSGELLALGRDMRPVANLRQQLVNAQQTLEQDYWRLRQVETRYRRMFELVGEAVLVVDGASQRVLEANPVAGDLLAAGQSVVGRPFPHGFDKRGTEVVEKLLDEARATGKGSVAGVRAEDGETLLAVSVAYLRQAGEARFLVRVAPAAANDPAIAPGAGQTLPPSLQYAPDSVLLTDIDGKVLGANRAFLELAQLLGEEQAMGHSADRWLGRSGVDFKVLLTNLRQRDSVRLFSSTLRGESGTLAEVEISACRIEDCEPPALIFFIRDVGRRVHSDHPMTRQLPRSIEQVTQRIGRIPLKELVRESKDVIEALCVEEALKLTHDNRASAAELLGLSRQSLYAKLRRYGIGGADSSGSRQQDD
jgi:transcriptional regulator PpsR